MGGHVAVQSDRIDGTSVYFDNIYHYGGFKYFLFSTLFGEDSHFDEYFSAGLKPTRFSTILGRYYSGSPP